MNCSEVRQCIRRWFDEGTELPIEAAAHAARCAGCGAYLDRLERLEETLHMLPVEAMPTELETRLAAQYAPYANRFRLYPGFALALALSIAAVLGGWYYPLPVEPENLWNQAATWAATLDLHGIGVWLHEQAIAVYRQLAGQLVARDVLSPLLMWGLLAGSALLLAAFNGFEAMTLRSSVPFEIPQILPRHAKYRRKHE
jgi:hypothetical protein